MSTTWLVTLAKRHHGIHTTTAHAYVTAPDTLVAWATDEVRGEVPAIDEATLIAAMPSGLLPEPANRVLLMAEDVDGNGSTAVGETTAFRRWGKYFDAYSITVARAAVPNGAELGVVVRGVPQKAA